MANIVTVKQEVTYKLELTEAEFATIVCAMRTSHSEIQEVAEEFGVENKILDRSEDSGLFFSLKKVLDGEA